MKDYPAHLGITQREWKQKKRKEWKAVMRALNEFATGCYFTPEYNKFNDIRNECKELQQAMSIKRWGR